MAQYVSPGVYTTIIDLSDYVQNVQSTVGFISIISEKGRDNQLILTSARSFFNEFGDPNYFYRGKTFSQGMYVASQFLKESDSLYVIRCMPENATYANMLVKTELDTSSSLMETAYFYKDTSGLYDVSETLTVTADAVGDTTALVSSRVLNSSVGSFKTIGSPSNSDLYYLTDFDRAVSAFSSGAVGEYDTSVNANNILGFNGVGRGKYYNNYQINIYKHPNADNIYKPKYLMGKDLKGKLVPLHVWTDATTYTSDTTIFVKPAEVEVDGTFDSTAAPYSFGMCNVNQIYMMDIFKKQKFTENEDTANPSYNIVGTFEVSLNNTVTDSEGESMFIQDRISRYFDEIRCKANEAAFDVDIDDDTSPTGFLDIINSMLKAEIILSEVSANGRFLSTDNPLDSSALSNGSQCWSGSISKFNQLLTLSEPVHFWSQPDSGDPDVKEWHSTDPDYEETPGNFDNNSDSDNYIRFITDFDITTGFSNYWDTTGSFVISNVYGVPLTGGSDGALFNDASCRQILAQAYNGTLKKPFLSQRGQPIQVSEVADTENYYFNIVMDGGYPDMVKSSIYDLVRNRRDCLAIIDMGDNKNAEDALHKRQLTFSGQASTQTSALASYNSRYLAMYDPYTKIYDTNTGRYIWITPMYHMANIIPYTDNVAELWYAPAGFNRAAVGGIVDTRYSPSLGEREVFYQNQINPIVRFNAGYVVWGQLTSQRRATALQDINVVRLVLYIKRALEEYTKYYIFEQNLPDTWAKVKAEVVSFLQVVQNKRGLRSFKVDVGASEYDIKAKRMYVNVSLVPVKVIEQINLNFFIF